jgi:hypothetical protein
MGQKQHKEGNKNLILELNQISKSYYEIYIYYFKNKNHYKSLISSSIIKELVKIKKMNSLISYIEEEGKISFDHKCNLLLSFNLDNTSYQFILYSLDKISNILYLFFYFDYLTFILIIISLINVFQKNKLFFYSFLKLIHCIIIILLFYYYLFYRGNQMYSSNYPKFNYKEHFYFIFSFSILIFINIQLIIGLLFVKTKKIENICLIGSLGLEGSMLYFWREEHFEKNTFSEIKKYFFKVKNNIYKYIKNKIK